MFENKPRSLTLPEYRETLKLREEGNVNEADIVLLSLAYGVASSDVKDWFHKAGVVEALRVLNAAHEASNATEGAQKSDPEGVGVVVGGQGE